MLSQPWSAWPRSLDLRGVILACESVFDMADLMLMDCLE